MLMVEMTWQESRIRICRRWLRGSDTSTPEDLFNSDFDQESYGVHLKIFSEAECSQLFSLTLNTEDMFTAFSSHYHLRDLRQTQAAVMVATFA